MDSALVDVDVHERRHQVKVIVSLMAVFALLGMEVIDSGVAVLSMHAPWELTSKADVYEAKRGYAAFLRGI